jgi:hypothetical protein
MLKLLAWHGMAGMAGSQVGKSPADCPRSSVQSKKIDAGFWLLLLAAAVGLLLATTHLRCCGRKSFSHRRRAGASSSGATQQSAAAAGSRSIDPAPVAFRGSIFPQPNLTARIFLLQQTILGD